MYQGGYNALSSRALGDAVLVGALRPGGRIAAPLPRRVLAIVCSAGDGLTASVNTSAGGSNEDAQGYLADAECPVPEGDERCLTSAPCAGSRAPRRTPSTDTTPGVGRRGVTSRGS